MIKTILTGFILGLILILFIPATLILISWNAIPGDSAYSIKVGLEKAVLGVTPSDNLKTTLEIKYTQRRFTEVEKIINDHPAQTGLVDKSLTNLTTQAIASKNSLQKIQNSAEKAVQTESLISTLEAISSKIEEKKQTTNTTPTPTKIPTKIPTKVPTSAPTVIKPDIASQPIITNKPSPTFTPVPTPTENTPSIIGEPNLEDTQNIIDGIIEDLKEESSIESTPNRDKNNSHPSKKDRNDFQNEDRQGKNNNRNNRRP